MQAKKQVLNNTQVQDKNQVRTIKYQTRKVMVLSRIRTDLGKFNLIRILVNYASEVKIIMF